MDELMKYDIILTTYTVLSSEVHYAAPPSSRSLRTQKKYVARRSPLVEMSWWRVCLDEAQMALGYSQAAEVAHKIPRINAWAVSGTPIKSDLQDCYGLLQFFQLKPFCYHKDVFSRLLDYNHEAFRALFRSFTLRHSKDIVRDELRLPPQNRVVVSVPFTQIEQQNYDGLFAQMCQETFVNELGEPLSDEWGDDEEVKKLYQIQRRFLIRLRQSCLHPEAGAQNRRALGGKDGPIRNVDEVLDVMIDQLVSKMRSDERELFVSMVKRGQLHVEEDRPQAGMDIWKDVLPMIQKAVAECREELANEIRNLETSGSAQEKEKQRQENPGEGERDIDMSDWDEIDDSEEEDEDAGRRSKKNRIAIARMRLRNFLEVEHACLYWIATGYHQLGQAHAKSRGDEERTEEEQRAFDGTTSEYTAKEEEFYGAAQKVRRELMTDTRTRALKYMGNIDARSNENHPKRFIDVPDIDPVPEVGLQAHRVLGNIDQLVDALNSQAIILDEWREKLCQLLKTQLFDQEVGEGTNEGKGENRGDEHEEAVVLQDQCGISSP